MLDVTASCVFVHRVVSHEKESNGLAAWKSSAPNSMRPPMVIPRKADTAVSVTCVLTGGGEFVSTALGWEDAALGWEDGAEGDEAENEECIASGNAAAAGSL